MKYATKTVALTKNGKDFSADFQCPVFESLDDVLSFGSDSEANAKNCVRWINHGADLKLRQPVRFALETQSAGPDAAIDKAVAQLLKARAATGRPISEERARQIVLGE